MTKERPLGLKEIAKILGQTMFLPEICGLTLDRLDDGACNTESDDDAGILTIIIPAEGSDISVGITTRKHRSLTFRAMAGGGKSPFTKAALYILAVGMMLDEEEERKNAKGGN
ncbi:hypothetical protein C4572_04115 [Candidatus Parcubacteria bacterium]|nr:MAG: hypothetical protein C4572_04115 [Candidatus Parcubacteria bacterium]